MRLQRLTGLEQDKITGEYKDVMAQIVDLLDILAKPARVTTIIGDELKTIRDTFGDKRRSEIVAQGIDLSIEDLIAPEDMVVTLSHGGYMKAQPVAEYRAQRRGGRGKQATATKEDDLIDHLFIANTHDYILCFSNRGRVYWLKVYNVPQGSRISRGKPIVNLVPLLEHEKITAILPVKEFVDDRFVFMATAHGTVKKTPLSEFSRPRPSGIIAVDLDDGDFLVGAALTDGKHDVMLLAPRGKAVRFEETDVRPMGRGAHGVRGMQLAKGQRVISMLVAEDEEQSVLTATENGYGKRTPIVEYTRHGRGTKGMIAIQQSGRNGQVVAAALVRPDDEVMLISTGGVLIRTQVKSIREMGRSTQGVTLINLGDGRKACRTRAGCRDRGSQRGVAPASVVNAPRGCRVPRAAVMTHGQRRQAQQRSGLEQLTVPRSTRSIASCCGCSPSARAMRRRSARSRTVRPTGLNARRRCCAMCRRTIRGRCPMRRSAACFARSCPRASRWSRNSRVAYLGPAGTLQPCRGDAPLRRRGAAEPCASIDEVFRAAEAGRTDYAIVPVENSTEGAVGRTLDLMCQTPLTIVGEIKLRIQQHLLAKGIGLDAVTKVYSHAQSLAQCVQWLAHQLPAAARVAVASNAEAARLASAERGAAAIAAEAAAAIYGLDIVAAHIEDEPNNTTRFWVLGAHAVPPSGKDETSLVMAAQNKPGAMVRAARAVRPARREHVALRVASGAYRPVGVLVLRRSRGPPGRSCGRRGTR